MTKIIHQRLHRPWKSVRLLRSPDSGGYSLQTALQMALKKINRRTAKTLIHHSDRGIQYCSAIYTTLLDAYHVQISMTETAGPPLR